MIYRFKKPIYLTNGKRIGNDDPHKGPLGGEAFIENPDQDDEITKAILAHCAKEAEENAAKKKKNT